MRIRVGSSWWLFLTGFLLCSCAAVDQFGSRIRDGNLNSQDAIDQETLLNIIRARDLQPLNFFAITQVTGGQTEALTTGLPTVTFGPATTMLQHQSPISNSLASGVSGGYQGNPLVSTTFQAAMLAPIVPRTVAWLVNAHPREPVFHMVLSQVAFRQIGTNKLIYFFNDPTGDTLGYNCPQRVAATPAAKLPALLDKCNYSLFQNFLGLFITGGLTVELVAPTQAPAKAKQTARGPSPAATPSPAPAAGPASGSGDAGASPPAPTGHICFNSASAFSNIEVLPKCTNARPQTTAPASRAPVTARFAGFGLVEVEFIFRSPLAVYGYLGQLLRTPEGNRFMYYTDDSRSIIGGEPFLDITTGVSGPCFTSVLYQGHFYCVPESSLHTAMLIDILIQLRNLSIQASDLNSAFTVRLTN